MGGGVGEHGDLLVLGGHVHDRVEHEVDEPEGAVDAGRGHVADRHRDGVGPGLARSCSAMCGDSSMPVHRHAPGVQRQGDAAGADRELQRGAAAGELGQASTAGSSTVGLEHRS